MANSLDSITLPLEPPTEGINIVTVQIRGGNSVSNRRRFDSSTTVLRTLFDFARLESIIQGSAFDTNEFRLVTRFPRRVYDIKDGDKTLMELGLGDETQIMLLLERI